VSFTGAVQQGWNATFGTSGALTVAGNAAYNGSLAPSGTATFGFIGSGAQATGLTCTAT
jgi:cellulase/cellobiase CelA1